MTEARVCFKERGNRLQVSLSIDGLLVLDEISVSDVARVLKAANTTWVTLADGFAFPLPTDSAVLVAAAAASLAHPFATFCLIAECSWSDEA